MTTTPAELSSLSGTWTLDPSKTAAVFRTKAVWFLKVKGTMKAISGAAKAANGNLSGRIEFDVASINTGIAKRDEHLRGSDFLDVTNHPNLTFTTTSIRFIDSRHAEVRGDLTLHGQARSLTFDAEIATTANTAVVTAQFRVDRRDFGVSLVRMGSGVFSCVDVTATFTHDR